MADILSPNDVVLSEGMTLQLECNASGAPLPEVIWSRDGATFDPQDSRVNMSGRTLVVTSVDEDDSGVYYCTATSSAGTVSTSTRLTVLDLSAENLTLTPGTFVSRHDFIFQPSMPLCVSALLGMSIELECSDALPVGVPVSWEFNRAPLLIPSDDYMVSVNGSLIVFDLMLEDEGLYSCVVDGLRLDRELEIFGRHHHIVCVPGLLCLPWQWACVPGSCIIVHCCPELTCLYFCSCSHNNRIS